MDTKKNPKANLENFSKLFMQLGLVLSLIIAYVLIQNKTVTTKIAIVEDFGRVDHSIPEQNVEYEIEKPKPKAIPKTIPLVVIKKEDNEADFEETLFTIIDPDAPVEEPQFEDPNIDDTIDIEETVPFLILEDVPVYPGCKGSNEERKACFMKKIGKFVNKKFDISLAEELGLASGVQKIYTIFRIDKSGNIVDIKARAPHKKLKQEAIRVINLLPKMKPGKQRGDPVNVKYSLPIAFKIQ
ncbi:MAG: energy transducer TonB [Lutibacter sp.]|uniref:energy transducer TonB n=1 Tax=Lutibacter sp. TaxID=1925666 RepID=UPI001A0718BD|nr:energy transducer TonB [Lutibacter sp.]NOR29051.1 energy transducer TonB [Lutibacter sp.]